MISLELMSQENSIDIYSFEKENQKYFEQNLLPRPINYFDLESFKEIELFMQILPTYATIRQSTVIGVKNESNYYGCWQG